MSWILFWEQVFISLHVVPRLQRHGYLFHEIWTPFLARKIPPKPMGNLSVHVNGSQSPRSGMHLKHMLNFKARLKSR